MQTLLVLACPRKDETSAELIAGFSMVLRHLPGPVHDLTTARLWA